jgi:outer membrane protein assembly factor BamB
MKKVTFLSLLLVAATALPAQEIIQWRGDRTGIYKETGLKESWPEQGPELLWNFDGLGEGHSSVAIASDKIYVTGLTDGKGYLYVFDLKGDLLNKKEYSGEWYENYPGTRGTVAIDNGKLYIVSGVGDIICLDEKSLDVVWTKNMLTEFSAKNITWGICESPLIVGEKLILTPGGEKNNIVALNKNTGAVIWTCPGEGDLSAYGSPLYLSDQKTPQVVVMTGKHIIGVNLATGEKLWSYEHANRQQVHPNTPIYFDNQLFCTSGYGLGSVMLRLTDGGAKVEKVWESAELDNRIGAMVKIGDYLYGSGDTNKYWFCADWKTGEQKYKDNTLTIGAVIADAGMLYCYTQKGEMALVKATPEKFDITGNFPITLGTDQHWAHPVIYKNTLYVRHGNTLMAYNIKK